MQSGQQTTPTSMGMVNASNVGQGTVTAGGVGAPPVVGASPVVNNSFGLGGTYGVMCVLYMILTILLLVFFFVCVFCCCFFFPATMSTFAPQGYAHNKHRVQGHSKQREGKSSQRKERQLSSKKMHLILLFVRPEVKLRLCVCVCAFLLTNFS